MEKDKDKIERNRPADKGSNNDPDVRDESALQPGIQTISTNKEADDANEHLTKTASDDFGVGDRFNKKADPTFEDIEDSGEE